MDVLPVIALAQNLLPQGTHWSNPIDWPAEATTAQATGTMSPADVADPSLTLRMAVEFSVDGGTNWTDASGGWEGGVIGSHDGLPAYPVVSAGPPPGCTNMRVRFDLPQPMSVGASVIIS